MCALSCVRARFLACARVLACVRVCVLARAYVRACFRLRAGVRAGVRVGMRVRVRVRVRHHGDCLEQLVFGYRPSGQRETGRNNWRWNDQDSWEFTRKVRNYLTINLMMMMMICDNVVTAVMEDDF